MDIVTSQNSNEKTDSNVTEETKESKTEKTADSLVGMAVDVDSQVDYLKSLGPNPVTDTNRKVTITEEHKNAFLACIVTGERYKESFDLFNGKLHVVIRCRSTEETDAIMTKMSRDVSLGSLKSDYEYAAEMRILMITAQVERTNDTIYPEMRAPLLQTAKGQDVTPPGWLEDFEAWKKRPEYILSALSSAIAEFEARYWRMVYEAGNINFWQPGGSTEQ